VPLEPPDSAGSEHDFTGVESSVKAMRGVESLAADLPSVALSELASPSAATNKQTNKHIAIL
jgi:hypothetical protein